jgi:hypothetical protein
MRKANRYAGYSAHLRVQRTYIKLTYDPSTPGAWYPPGAHVDAIMREYYRDQWVHQLSARGLLFPKRGEGRVVHGGVLQDSV